MYTGLKEGVARCGSAAWKIVLNGSSRCKFGGMLADIHGVGLGLILNFATA
jgi:hypothetical protein